MKKLAEENVNNGSFHLYIVGKGEEEVKLKELVKKYNVSEKITFLGFQSNPYPYVKNADLFVCSSYNEGFSTAVTESIILGTPVITTLCSGMKEILGDNNEYGFVTENNEEELYQGIKYLIENPDTLSSYKNLAKLRGNAFTMEKTIKETEAFFDSILNGDING